MLSSSGWHMSCMFRHGIDLLAWWEDAWGRCRDGGTSWPHFLRTAILASTSDTVALSTELELRALSGVGGCADDD